MEAERLKALLYDLERAKTDIEKHDLILYYSRDCDNIMCIKDVIMEHDPNDIPFTKKSIFRCNGRGIQMASRFLFV